ncbi:hypothetical protein [Longitalea luteola]|uniref:hypothetical protein n=1 Tax=Longitalea luteola TaxID=2812563 RepID=UPI001A96B8A7|nr:hypothetical protein [Longitalea luteola]
MDERLKNYLEELERRYIAEVRNFLEALQKDASPRELIAIRKNAKEIFNEIKNKSKLTDNESG